MEAFFSEALLSSSLNALAAVSFVFELLALALGFYFKDSRVFFIALATLCARSTYLWASIYHAHLFVSLFLPLVCLLFIASRKSVLVFEKVNLAKLALLAFVGILAFFLVGNTDFIATMQGKKSAAQVFEPLSPISFKFFRAELLLLFLLGIFRREFHLIIAFALLFVQFCFKTLYQSAFFEGATLFLGLWLLYHSYKSLYFDTLTHLANEKMMKRRLFGRSVKFLAAIKLTHDLDAQNEKKILRKIAKVLRRQHSELYRVDGLFVFVFADFDELKIRGFLQNVSQKLAKALPNFGVKCALIKAGRGFDEDLDVLKREF